MRVNGPDGWSWPLGITWGWMDSFTDFVAETSQPQPGLRSNAFNPIDWPVE